jgi:regulator of RNase E activity RraB
VSDNLKQVDRAKSVLEVFDEHGEDMKDVRHVIHYFYGGNFEALRSALTELGYKTGLTVKEDGVVAERYEAIGEDWRTSTLVHLCELADTYGVEYDGWEASMTRQESLPKKLSGSLLKLPGKKD